MKKIIFPFLVFALVVSGFSVSAQNKENQIVVKQRKNSEEQMKKPYVVLISIDGFRYDYIEKYELEFLKNIGQKGARAESLIPSYPSVTFPNHYSIVTGMYPAHHGLVGNNMLDSKTGARYSLRNEKEVRNPSWYGGTPLWVLAEQQQMLSACYYWPGSEAPIQGTLPTYYYAYSEKTPIDERIKEVKNWLDMPEESRPHFITFYMPEVDHAGHQYGPDSPEVKDAVHFVDESLTKLFDILNSTALPINYIVVSDHGMINIDQDVLLDFPVKVDSEELDIVKNGTYISVFVKGDKNKSDKIKKWYSQLKEGKNKEYYDVYLHDELPEEFYFGGKNDVYGRVGDIVLLAKAPYYFTNHKIAGSHGYDPVKVKEMQAVFLAYGPQIDEGRKVKPFQNVEIYPLIAKILQLDMPKHKIDGSGKMADEILKR